MTFKEAFKFPLELRFGSVYDANFHKVFDFISRYVYPDAVDVSDESKQKLIRMLNGSKEITKPNNYQCIDGVIYVNKQPCIRVRGWGYLTGTGGLNLEPEEAIIVQKEIEQYILNTLQNTEE